MIRDMTDDKTADLLYLIHHAMGEVSTRLELAKNDREYVEDCADEINRMITYVEENEDMLEESLEAQDRRDGQAWIARNNKLTQGRKVDGGLLL